MGGRTRRAAASAAAIAFLIFWIWGAASLADLLPDNMLLKVVYFAVAGTAWGLPLFPLIAWANRGGDRP